MLATLERWGNLCKRIGAQDNPVTSRTIDGTYHIDLILPYTEPDRHYHSINHIDEGLEIIDLPEVRRLAENPDLLEMEWWWHDQTYKKGKESALQFLIGQVMSKTKGLADPQSVADLLKKRLL